MTEPYYSDEAVTLYHGDNREVLKHLHEASLDAVVTDPPYGLEFMGEWDAPWQESGINTDAGFNGGGVSATKNAPSFTSSTNPNCLNCGGKQRGRRDGTAVVAVCVCSAPLFPNTRATEMRAFQSWCTEWVTECLRVLKPGGHLLAFGGTRTWHRLACAIEDAGFEVRDSIAWQYGSGFPKSHNLKGEWQGWGTALKPAFEPIVVARKPLTGTVAANVQQWGTGALNIDGCRIGTEDGTAKGNPPKGESTGIYGDGINGACDIRDIGKGRWPANVIFDESQAAELDRQSGVTAGRVGMTQHGSGTNSVYGTYARTDQSTVIDGTPDVGGASRFFYTAKADSSERPRVDGIAHPTVKPLDLMRYLVRLVTPPGGTVLEPFAGSGTTAEACIIEGFRCVAIEMTDDYLPLIMQRITKPIEVTLL
jgi:site-specific DNA-methyltransferase (adenine-specific)